MTRARTPWIWLLVGAGLLLLIGANTHLVYVAMRSQPDCVAHARLGDGGGFGAARSACTPGAKP